MTGEMSHHEVLEASSLGVSIVLCEHSNTERGWLHVYKGLIEKEIAMEASIPDTKIYLSLLDHEPIVTV